MNDAQPIIFALEPHPLFNSLCQKLTAVAGRIDTRHFPDGETYLRVEASVADCDCIILANLSHPDGKFLPLVFLAATLRELGASSVGLIAPYLSYMRQDCRFIEGEAITSRIFAKQVSQQVDWLVTVDPHLHRYRSLNEIYDIPCCVVQGAAALADWLKDQEKVFLVGPDAESEQWVSQIASHAGLEFVVGEKQRYGDRDVVVTLPDLSHLQAHTAMIIDDVISSGQTILSCVEALKEQGIKSIKCAAVHGIFANNIDDVLLQSGLVQLITTNTIPHRSNHVEIADLLVTPVLDYLHLIRRSKL
ncbi:Ribose-phosphate pyrophosphokinase [gamma proteobacterium IMCC2047]|nr:Ribose-phosphate pyrophosphokinase [gamma proteobacterium IMCC2047]